MVDNTEQDDGIIELTQLVEADSSDATDPDVIELTDIDTPMEGVKEDDLDLDFDFDMDDMDMGETIEPVLEQASEIPEPILPITPISGAPDSGVPVAEIDSSITQEQIDDALERVIEKKFAKTIEKSLLEVMEKVLEREIADIRKRLQKDLDEIVSS